VSGGGKDGLMAKGFSLIELLVVVAIIAVLAGIAIPLMQHAMLRAHVGATASDARIMHTAFKRYFLDFNMYPNSEDAPAFELDTFEPLVSEGYYDGHIAGKLKKWTADAYDSPDDEGINQEFWIELTLGFDNTVRFVVADSDNAPLAGGAYVDGVYLYKNGVLHSLTTPIDK
jgi:prepilin-type N-terminal cleavage/methylation domain-containing protein